MALAQTPNVADRTGLSTANSFVRVEVQDRTGTIWLDRPPLNVMDIAMMREIHGSLLDLAKRCDILVFRGAGEKEFSAGAAIADHTPDRVAEMLYAFHAIFRELWRGPMITIAAVHGNCLGGGCELASFCDFVIASESAVFGQPEIKLGCFPPVAMITLPRLIGLRNALDLILTGRQLSAAEAQGIGLINRVVPEAELDRALTILITEMHSLSPIVLALTRRKLWRAEGFDLERSLDSMEEFYLRDLMKTHDATEGIRAFLEKRQPLWQDQ